MTEILEQIKKLVPNYSKISDTAFEGANIILYTKDKGFFLDNGGIIKEVVNTIKKRVELRPDPAITGDMEKSEKIMRELIPEDAKVSEIIFDPQRSRAIIEAEKPGSAIGKQGEILKEIRKQTMWVPLIRRTPALRSKIIENIRAVLYQNSDYRRKFLDKVGHRIYDGPIKSKKEDWVRVTYLGGGRQVGRSCLFLQTPESKVLLDCGVNVAAPETSMYPLLEAPEFKLEELDAVILSHAHIDHSGLIPYLYKMGFRGPTYCTPPTRDVSALLALDYIGVAFKQARKTLFDSSDVKEMVMHTVCVDYEEVTDITPDLRLTFYNAGHIVGSSLCHLHVGNGLHNLVYTGDLKYLKTKVLEPATSNFPRLETLMIEATYGGKDNILGSRMKAEDGMIEVINKAIDEKGKVLIPVLGVGRAQEALLIIEDAIMKGRIKEKIPVYVQGLVWDVTAIHTAYPDYLGRTVRQAIFRNDTNPFLSDIFKKIAGKKEQEEVINSPGPCVIVATSGMLTAGASVEYFRHMYDNPRNAVMFLSYQSEGTLGRIVQSGMKNFTYVFDDKPENVDMKIAVHNFADLSGHAGRSELMNYLRTVNPKPKKVLVNHGESSRCLDLASSIHKMYRIETDAPKNLETVRLK